MPGLNPGNNSRQRGVPLPALALGWSVAGALIIISLLGDVGLGCPFCLAVSSTLTADLAQSSAAAVAACESLGVTRQGHSASMNLRIIEVFKGDHRKLVGRKVQVISGLGLQPGEHCLLLGRTETAQEWAVAAKLPPEAIAYLRSLVRLPEQGRERLVFFLAHLDSRQPLVADDAYNEFAQASLAEVEAIREHLDRTWIWSQLERSDLPAHRRRLCWTLLSVCGAAEDLPLIGRILQRSVVNGSAEPGLDAAIACYLALGGEMALRQVERDFLANPRADYGASYAAIRAVRVHGDELNHFARERLAAALRHVLERPAIADLVIPDLARWQDWSVVERLTELFQRADAESQFLKVPVLVYLRACPVPAAAAALKQLRVIDPEADRRAETISASTAAPAVARAAATSSLVYPGVATRPQGTSGPISGAARDPSHARGNAGGASPGRPRYLATAALLMGLFALAALVACIRNQSRRRRRDRQSSPAATP